MRFNKQDVVFDTKRGSGPGGQHRNKTDSCVTATHVPTGLTVTIDDRKQAQNKKKALKELKKRFDDLIMKQRAELKKASRDFRIQNTRTIRTYNFKRGTVKDHRSGKVKSLSKMLDGQVDLCELSTPMQP